MRKSKILKRILAFIFAISFVLILYGVWVFYTFYSSIKTHNDIFESTYSRSVLDRDGQLLSVFLDKNGQWHLKAIHPVPQKLSIAVLTYEDKRFYHHFGVDLLALMRSVAHNITFKRRLGGSTISMQVVKLYLKPKRNYKTKFEEIFQSLALESVFSKDEILSLYLNNAPYGGNIIGYHSASLLFFGKDSSMLTWAESALLAVLPNAPGLFNVHKNTQILKNKRDNLLRTLHKKGYFDETILSLALSEPIPTQKIIHRNIAPHLSLNLIAKHRESNIISTIDKSIQERTEKRIKQYHNKLLPQGILNIAALIVDTQSGEILAYVGSQDFFDIEGFGQIDGVRALRSPGSLLKPFLYAKSIDEGLIAPQSMLVDVPLFFSNFNPQNSTKTYQGLIPAQIALQKSLNVPFVKLLHTYGYERFFYELSAMAGFNDKGYQRYGLSFILGSKELSLLHIARLYMGLGNYGQFGNIYALKNEPKVAKKQLISKGSAYLTLQTLKELKREGELDYQRERMVFSWKSGTSYGQKDAWAAGVSPKYTIVVWIGNFTGQSNPNIMGVKTAGSLMFALLEMLPQHHIDFIPPESALHSIKVDKFSSYGLNDEARALLGKNNVYNIIYPREAKTLNPSPFYKKVFVVNGVEVSSKDKNFIYALPQLKLSIPLNVLAYYKLQNINITKHISHSSNLKIIYPTRHIHILQPKDLNEQKPLIIRIANLKNQRVFWYLNKELINTSAESTLTLHLRSGRHSLGIVGEDGSMDNVVFSIQ